MARSKFRVIKKRPVKPKQIAAKSSLRSSLIASAPSLRPRSWFDKLEASSPKRAAEVKSLFAEWQNESSEIRNAYPTKHQFAHALAVEFGVSNFTILRAFDMWGA